MTRLSRRTTLALLAGLSCLHGLSAHSQPPSVVRIIVAYPPGGAGDTVARLLADRLCTELGRPVIVENRAGADGLIAMEAVSKSPADGSVLLFSAISPLTIAPHVRKLPFDLKSVAPLTPVMYSPGILAATSATGAKSLAELLAEAKKSPGSVRWGNSGSVSLSLLLAEQLKAASGADIVVVPYKGGGQLVTDALGGQFEVAALTSTPPCSNRSRPENSARWRSLRRGA